MQLLWWALKALNTGAPMQPAVTLLGMYSKGLNTGFSDIVHQRSQRRIHNNGSKGETTQMCNR